MYNSKLFFSIAMLGSLFCAFTMLLPCSSEAHALKSHAKRQSAAGTVKPVAGTQSQESSPASQNHVRISSLVNFKSYWIVRVSLRAR